MTFTHIIEISANIAQIVLVIGLYVAWKQLFTAINDIDIRSKREAGTLAIKEAERFAEEIIPLYTELNKKIGGFQPTSQRLDRFVFSEIEPVNVQKYKNSIERLVKAPEVYERLVTLTNRIDSIAIYFTKGIADEAIVFESIGHVYCEIIEELYSFYCHYRKNTEEILPYENTLLLYRIWKVKLENVSLEVSKNLLEERSRAIKDSATKTPPVKPIGTR